jgi:hypothetical protein
MPTCCILTASTRFDISLSLLIEEVHRHLHDIGE